MNAGSREPPNARPTCARASRAHETQAAVKPAFRVINTGCSASLENARSPASGPCVHVPPFPREQVLNPCEQVLNVASREAIPVRTNTMLLTNKQVTRLPLEDCPASDRDTSLGFLALAGAGIGSVSPVQNGDNYRNGKQRVRVGGQPRVPWHLTSGSPSWCRVYVS